MNTCQLGSHRYRIISHRSIFRDGLDRETRVIYECARCKHIKTDPHREGVNTQYRIIYDVWGFKIRRRVSITRFTAYFIRNQDCAEINDSRTKNEVTVSLKKKTN